MMSAGFILSEEDGDTFLRHYGGQSVDVNDELQQQQQQEQQQLHSSQLYDLQLTYTLFRTQQVHSLVFLQSS